MRHELNLAELPVGTTYENTYGEYMKLFRWVAESGDVTVKHPPIAWIPLLHYLGADITFPVAMSGGTFRINHDAVTPPGLPTLPEMERQLAEAEAAGRLREFVEGMESLRPELVDALYKSDMEWKTVGRRHQTQKEFVITTNGSFQRPEVLAYMDRLPTYESRATAALLLPCAADKPYPSPLHTRALEVVRAAAPQFEWEIVVFTGTLGFCPAGLWEDMPHYDSGMPNQWRVQQMATDFIPRQPWSRVLVYGDFYNKALIQGLVLASYKKMHAPYYRGPGKHDQGPIYRAPYSDQIVFCVNPDGHYTEYLDLLDPKYLARLLADAQVLSDINQ